MLQTVIAKDKFNDEFGFNMRRYVLSRMKEIHKLVADAEAEIPDKYWIKTDEKTKVELDNFSKQIRVALKEDGTHHPKALRLLWKIRCSEFPTRAECGDPE